MNDLKRIALHEAAHGVVAELMGWRVRALHAHEFTGLTTFECGPPHPLADISVSCIGHAAECYYGQGVRCASRSDRTDTRRALARLGVRASTGILREVEERLSGLFWSLPCLARMVSDVAEALEGSNSGVLKRAEFLAAAGPSIRSRWLRHRVRRLCEWAVLDAAGFTVRSHDHEDADAIDRSAFARAAASVVLAALIGVDVRSVQVRSGGSIRCSFAATGEPWKSAAVAQAADSFAAGRSTANRLGVVFDHPRIRSAVRGVASTLGRIGFIGPASARASAGDVLNDPAARERAERIARVAVSGFRG